MRLSERTGRAIEACYDAVLAPEGWPTALQLLAESLGADSCTFSTGNAANRMRMPRSDGHEDFAQLWLKNEAHAPDPHVTRRPCRHLSGRSYVLEDDVTTEEERRTLPYFRETARPGNRDWWAMACFRVTDHGWCLPLYRGQSRGPFTVREANYFVQVVPHLTRVIGLAQALVRSDTDASLGLLQRLGVPAIVIDDGGVAIELNAGAGALLGADFALCRGRPVAPERSSNRRLQDLIAAARVKDADAVVGIDALIVSKDGVPRLLVEAMSLTAFGRSAFATGATLLLLTDLAASSVEPRPAFGAAFGLTPAEARLANSIAAGIGIDRTAASVGIGRETARSQLKAVFAKTGTNSQAGLVALAARFLS